MRWLAYHASRFICKSLLAPFVKVSVLAPETTGLPGAWILAANHISHFDPPLIGVHSRRKVDWMAMRELFENPVAAAWLRGIDTFPVDRARVDRSAVRTALERLKRGHVVGMFPEGGIRNGDRSVLSSAPIRPGVGAIAQMSGAPVLPCVILGSDRLYNPKNWIPLRKTHVYIAFGQQMNCEGSGKAVREQFEQRLASVLRDLFHQLDERFGLTADDFPRSAQYRKGREP